MKSVLAAFCLFVVVVVVVVVVLMCQRRFKKVCAHVYLTAELLGIHSKGQAALSGEDMEALDGLKLADKINQVGTLMMFPS